MSPRKGSARRGKPRQEGYALLMAIFLVATILILATAITPNILTEGRREREQEAIWRGHEYVRAIELYYRKNGHYPQTIDDITKGNLSVHFLRKQYTDPMNTDDGSWRFIYVSPTGQLIGSVKYHSLQEMAAKLNLPGAGQALPNGSANNGQQAQGQPNGQQVPGQVGATDSQNSAPGSQQQNPGQQFPEAGGQPSVTGGATSDQLGATPNNNTASQGFAPTQGAFASSFGSSGSSSPGSSSFGSSSFGSAQPAALAPLEPVDGPVLGAFLIGVASKVKKSSLIVYQGGKTYFEWEFIYNPLAVAGAGGISAPGAPGGAVLPSGALPGANGSSPSSSGFGFSGAPAGNAPVGLPPMTGNSQ